MLTMMLRLACCSFFLTAWSLVYAESLPINTRLGGDFELLSTSPDAEGKPGKAMQLSDFQGKLVLLNFGYTHCPDICPMVLARITQVMKRLQADAEKVQPVFVSFDTDRDSAQRLKEYLGYFHPSIVGFTGSKEAIAATTKQYGVVFIPRDSGSAAGVLYAHSDYIYLLDRQGRVRALFATDTPLPKMVADIRSLL